MTLKAEFWRGGTSNGLLIQRSDLPRDQSKWQPILSAAMGSPDPYVRQLNGMGGGISSLSKICIVEPSNRQDADVDFTFIQLGIKDGSLDMAGNCGNMSSAIGPYAFNNWHARVAPPEGSATLLSRSIKSTTKSATMRIFNTNTQKIIHSTFALHKSPECFNQSGDYSIDGVPGTGSRIELSFLSPGGSKTGKTLPTGSPVDILRIPGREIRASLVDVANPGVFVSASDLGVDRSITPSSLDADTETMATLEQLRQEGARMMGLDPLVGSIPKILLLFPPDVAATLNGIDIQCQALSMGQAHKAVPLTLALNLGVACNLEGTIAHSLANQQRTSANVVIGHPSGKLEVGAKMVGQEVKSAILHRTARMLMKGMVNATRY